MCSISLNTRVKDKRNIIANLSYYYDDKFNVPFTQEDTKKKCEIFNINTPKFDFITKKPLTGIGDHYYPLCADIKKYKRIGSDSQWNRIPVSGNNSKYKTQPEYQEVIKQWINYTHQRNAKLYYNISELHMQLLTQLTDDLVKINEHYFDKLCQISLQ